MSEYLVGRNRLIIVTMLHCEQFYESTYDLQSPTRVDRQVNISIGCLTTGSSSHAALRGQSDRCWPWPSSGDDGRVAVRRKSAACRWRQRRGAGQMPRTSATLRPARFVLVPATVWDVDRMWSAVHQNVARAR